jgi:excisionase family DNA binding protein
LSVASQTVQKWVDDGRLKAWRTVGGHRRVDADSVQALLDTRQSLQPTPAPAPQATSTVYLVAGAHLDLSTWQPQLQALLPKARIEVFGHAVAALLAIGRRTPDLLITDATWSGLDTAAALKQLQQEPATTNMHVAVVASGGRREGKDGKIQGRLPERVTVIQAPLTEQALRPLVAELQRRAAPPKKQARRY